MKLPQIKETVSGYIFSWEEEHISVEVSRLHNHNDGRITGELAISTTMPGYSPHLHQAQFNFSATRSRNELSRVLDERYGKLADWPTLLEQLCFYTLDRMRRGEPVVELRAGDNIKPPKYLLDPLILKNNPSIIYGDPGTAKSTVALIISQLMANTDDNFGLEIIPPSQPIRCLYLDYETDEDTVRWLLTKLQRGTGFSQAVLPYRRCALPLATDLEQINRHIHDTGADVIIIDSLGLACGGDLKDPQAALGFFSALRQLRVTSLILAHTAKNPETKKRSVFGSVFFEAQARSIWEVWKRQDLGESEMDIALFNRKPPPFQKLFHPVGMHIDFGVDTIEVSAAQPRNVSEFLAGLGTQMQIQEILKHGAISTKEITDTLDITRRAADSAIKRLRDKGKITKVGDKWGLAEIEREEDF